MKSKTNLFADLTPQQANDLVIGMIGTVICGELAIAQDLTPAQWDERDIYAWSSLIARRVYTTIQAARLQQQAG